VGHHSERKNMMNTFEHEGRESGRAGVRSVFSETVAIDEVDQQTGGRGSDEAEKQAEHKPPALTSPPAGLHVGKYQVADVFAKFHGLAICEKLGPISSAASVFVQKQSACSCGY
jgi:hypothetical protein